MNSNKYYVNMWDKERCSPELFDSVAHNGFPTGLQGCTQAMTAQSQRIKPISGFEISVDGTTYIVNSGYALIDDVLTAINSTGLDVSTDNNILFTLDRNGANILHNTTMAANLAVNTGYIIAYKIGSALTKQFPDKEATLANKNVGCIDARNSVIIGGESYLYAPYATGSIYFLTGAETKNQKLSWGNGQIELVSPTIKLSGSMEISGSITLTGQLSMPNSPIISPLSISTPTNDAGFIIKNRTTATNRTIYITSAAEWASLFTANVYNGNDGDVLILCGSWTDLDNARTIGKSISIYGRTSCIVNIVSIASDDNIIKGIGLFIGPGEILDIHGSRNVIDACYITIFNNVDSESITKGIYLCGGCNVISNCYIGAYMEISITITADFVYHYIYLKSSGNRFINNTFNKGVDALTISGAFNYTFYCFYTDLGGIISNNHINYRIEFYTYRKLADLNSGSFFNLIFSNNTIFTGSPFGSENYTLFKISGYNIIISNNSITATSGTITNTGSATHFINANNIPTLTFS